MYFVYFKLYITQRRIGKLQRCLLSLLYESGLILIMVMGIGPLDYLVIIGVTKP